MRKLNTGMFPPVALIVILSGCFACANGVVFAEEKVYSDIGRSDHSVREVYIWNEGDVCYGAIDEEGNVIIAPTGGSIYVSNRNGYVVTSRAGKIYNRPDFGLISQSQVIHATGGETLDFDKYLTYFDGSYGIAVTGNNNIYKYGIIDRFGNMLTDFEYDAIEVYADNSDSSPAFFAKKGEYWGIIKHDGNSVLPFEYRFVRNYAGSNDAYVAIAMNNGWNEGMVNKNTGQIIIPPSYSFVGGFYDGFCAVSNGEGKFAFFNLLGENVTGFIFDNVQRYSEGLAAVLVDGKWGYISMDQQMVINPIYDEASEFHNGYAEVTADDNKEMIESPVMKHRKGGVNVYLNGKWVFSEEPPYIVSSRTMLPIRAMAEALGFGVKWYPSEQKIEIQNESRILQFVIGRSEATVNIFDDGESAATVLLDVAPEIRGGRTYLPLRFIAENLGYEVSWNAESRSVSLR